MAEDLQVSEQRELLLCVESNIYPLGCIRRLTPFIVVEEGSSKLGASASSNIQKLISNYGSLPLHDTSLPEPEKPTAETILAVVIDALVKSTRVSHNIANDAVKCLINAGYHDINKLKQSSWDEKTRVLTEGGYARYREKAATELENLASWVIDNYSMWSNPFQIPNKGRIGHYIYIYI